MQKKCQDEMEAKVLEYMRRGSKKIRSMLMLCSMLIQDSKSLVASYF